MLKTNYLKFGFEQPVDRTSVQVKNSINHSKSQSFFRYHYIEEETGMEGKRENHNIFTRRVLDKELCD